MKWQTRFGDEVVIGDLVALSLVGNPDAKGWIVGPSDDGRVLCILSTQEPATGPRPVLAVDADDLLLLLHRGEEPPT